MSNALKSAVKRRRPEARVLLDQSLLDEHTRLAGELDRAISRDADENRNPQAPAIAEQITELEQRIDDARTVFAFERIGRVAWLALLAEHPPRPEDEAAGIDHNPDTFVSAALVASCVEVRNPDAELDLETAQYLVEELDIAEFRKLWGACLLANLGTVDDPKSAAAAVYRRLTLPSSIAAFPSGSPEVSS